MKLEGKRVAILAADMFERVELLEPRTALEKKARRSTSSRSTTGSSPPASRTTSRRSTGRWSSSSPRARARAGRSPRPGRERP